MDGVDLNAIDAGFLAKLGGLSKGGDHLLDLFDRQSPGRGLIGPTVRIGRGRGANAVDVEDGFRQETQELIGHHLLHRCGDGEGPAEAGGQLNEHLGARLMEFDHVVLQLLVHVLVAIEPFAKHRVEDRGDTR